MQSLLTCLSPEWATQRAALRQRIQTVSANSFEPLALDIFRYQAALNPVYRLFLDALRVQPEQVQQLRAIPFLPISFFKHHRIISANQLSDEAVERAVCFASSGTTGVTTSRHYLFDTELYHTASQRIFEERYGPLSNYHILALLPSYLERNNSSLVYMVQEFIAQTGSAESGFYLHDTAALSRKIEQLLATSSRSILLIGVTFALLDWVETIPDLSFIGHSKRVVVMETGGMKGRRREMLREEVHEILTNKLSVDAIHSEYGMTELLSQGYSTGEGLFRPGATMRILLRDVNDPLTIFAPSEGLTGSRLTGGINVIDLANLDSCSFIETQDLGQNGPEPDTFRVIGRFDNSDIRGCNLMVF